MNKIVPFNQYVKSDAVHDRIVQMLGPIKAPEFLSSLVATVNSSPALANCSPPSIINAALKIVELNLPLGLGAVAIVPYGDQAQIQIQRRGLIQLMLRSGEISVINGGDVRKGELRGVDRLRGIHKFDFVEDETKRNKLPVVGYFAYFQTKSGFEKTEYMSVEEIEEHAKKYSKNYRAYLAKKLPEKHCFWVNEHRETMMAKTPMLRLIRNWAPMSTSFANRLADALKVDQAVFDNQGSSSYADNSDDDVIEAEIVEAEEEFKAKKPAKKKAKEPEPEPEVHEPSVEETAEMMKEMTEDAGTSSGGEVQETLDWEA